MEKKLVIYNIIACLTTSIIIMLIFYIFALAKVGKYPELFEPVDVYGGLVYVFIISMIVSLSIWPGIIEKKF